MFTTDPQRLAAMLRADGVAGRRVTLPLQPAAPPAPLHVLPRGVARWEAERPAREATQRAIDEAALRRVTTPRASAWVDGEVHNPMVPPALQHAHKAYTTTVQAVETPAPFPPVVPPQPDEPAQRDAAAT